MIGRGSIMERRGEERRGVVNGERVDRCNGLEMKLFYRRPFHWHNSPSAHTSSTTQHQTTFFVLTFCSILSKHVPMCHNVSLLFIFLLCVDYHIKRWQDGAITMSEDNSASWSVIPGSVWHQWASCYTTCQKHGHNQAPEIICEHHNRASGPVNFLSITGNFHIQVNYSLQRNCKN